MSKIPNLSSLITRNVDDSNHQEELMNILNQSSTTTKIKEDFPQIHQEPVYHQEKQIQTHEQQSQKQAVVVESEEQKIQRSILEESEKYNKQQLFNQNSEIQPQGSVFTPPNQKEEPKDEEKLEVKEDQFTLALKLLEDLNFIKFSEEDLKNANEHYLQQLAEDYRQAHLEQALDLLESEFTHDPFMKKMFDYARDGKKFSDIPRMAEQINTEIDFESLNLSNKEVQRELLNMYLSHGKNPSVGPDLEFLQFIPQRIKYFEDNNLLDSKAKEAQTFFINETRKKQEALYKESVRKQEEKLELERRQKAENDKWTKEFYSSLASSNINKDTKDKILNELDFVRFEDGSAMPIYQYKQNLIFQDPKLFKYFLNFLTNFNPKSGEFEYSSNPNASTEVLGTFLNRLNKKDSGSGMGTQGSGPLAKTENKGADQDPTRTLSRLINR